MSQSALVSRAPTSTQRHLRFPNKAPSMSRSQETRSRSQRALMSRSRLAGKIHSGSFKTLIQPSGRVINASVTVPLLNNHITLVQETRSDVKSVCKSDATAGRSIAKCRIQTNPEIKLCDFSCDCASALMKTPECADNQLYHNDLLHKSSS